MGMVNITIRGSFGKASDKTFSAMEGGHAMALTRAIAHLTDQLPHAIQLDHKLAKDGDKPPQSDFGQLPAIPQIAWFSNAHTITTAATAMQRSLEPSRTNRRIHSQSRRRSPSR
jgi:hypothetical protein